MPRGAAFGILFLCLNVLAAVSLGCAAGEQPAAPEVDATATIAAQPQAKDSPTEFEVRTAAIAKWYSRVTILLSDREADPLGSSGTWEILSSDLEGDYHRVEITLAELPTAAGEYTATRLTYSVRDANMGPFNFGWSEIEGSVSISEVLGTADAENGVVVTAHVVGTFAFTNNKGGRFSGRSSSRQTPEGARAPRQVPQILAQSAVVPTTTAWRPEPTRARRSSPGSSSTRSAGSPRSR